MNKNTCLLILFMPALCWAKEQCLPPHKAIEGHCKEIKTKDLACPQGQKYFDCKAIAKSCPDFSEEAPFAFKSYQPVPKTIERVNFPRNDRYLYRGVPFGVEQMTFEKFVGAIFGDALINIGSVYQWRFSQLLSGQISVQENIQHKSAHGSLESILKDMDIYSEYKKLISCSSEYSARDAHHYASQLMAKNFSINMTKRKIEERFLKFDYSEGSEYLDYGNWGQYLIFSSIYYDVASFLSGQIIMFNNKYERSMDLNFYNHMNGELWTYHDSDNGEFVTPGTILPDEVEGYIISSGNSKSAGYLEADSINYAFIKRVVDGENYILLVDGNGETCLTKNESGLPYFCRQKFKDHGHRRDNPSDDLKSHIFGPPTPTKRATVYGVIAPKTYGKENALDFKKVYKDLKISDRQLRDSFFEQVAAISFFNGDKVMGAKVILPPVKRGIEIISATFGKEFGGETDNLYPYVARYCDGKDSCGYSTRPGRYFPEFVSSQAAKAQIKYRCVGKDESILEEGNIGEVINLNCD